MPDRIQNTIDELVRSSVDGQDMLLSREETLRKKLAVLVTTLHGRLSLNASQHATITDSLGTANHLLDRMQTHLSYGVPVQRSDVERTQDVARSLEQEIRTRNSECWGDVVSVMRDILMTWEELQAVAARAHMINDTRPDDSGYL